VEDVVKPEVGYVAKTINLEADQDVLECSKKENVPRCSKLKEKEDATRHIAATDIVDPDTGSYLSSSDEFDSSDESSSLEKSVSDKEDDEIDKEAEDGKYDSDDELWSSKSIGTTS
ncbi:hypothetical protein Tco_0979538, partial [Tanacetum coccineum]